MAGEREASDDADQDTACSRERVQRWECHNAPVVHPIYTLRLNKPLEQQSGFVWTSFAVIDKVVATSQRMLGATAAAPAPFCAA